MKTLLSSLLIIGLISLVPQLRAAEDAAASLAKESEDFCTATIKDQPTSPETVVGKVNEACALLEKEGRAAFPKFSGKDTPFIYDGTYITVHTLADHICLVHPIKFKMVGQNITSFKDAKGKRFYLVEDELAAQKGDGWVEYYWPKPGTQDAVRKITYIKKCKLPDGVEVVVCSGFYRFDAEAISKLIIN